MKINRRAFLTTGALGGGAAVIGAQAQNNPKAGAPIKTNEPRVTTRLLKDAATIPNSRLPVMIYQGALDLPKDDPASAIEALIHANQWGDDWRNGIFTYITITARRTKRCSFSAVRPKFSWAANPASSKPSAQAT